MRSPPVGPPNRIIRDGIGIPGWGVAALAITYGVVMGTAIVIVACAGTTAEYQQRVSFDVECVCPIEDDKVE